MWLPTGYCKWGSPKPTCSSAEGSNPATAHQTELGNLGVTLLGIFGVQVATGACWEHPSAGLCLKGTWC